MMFRTARRVVPLATAAALVSVAIVTQQADATGTPGATASTVSATTSTGTSGLHWLSEPPEQVLRPVLGDSTFTVSAQGAAGTVVTWAGRGATCRGEHGSGTTAFTATCQVRDRSRGGTVSFRAKDATGTLLTAKSRIVSDVAFVALGDSYASGEANPPFVTDEYDTTANGCHRSENAAARQVFERAPRPRTTSTTFRHVACSGAKIADLSAVYKGEDPQLTRLAQTPDVSLVTLTVGGNDIGFGAILGQCLPNPAACEAALAAAQAKLDAITTPAPEFGGISRLERAYRDVRQAAPDARIVVTGYPKLFPAGGSPRCAPLTAPVTDAINGVVTELNRRIDLTTQAVDGVDYADLAGPFTGHSSCEEDTTRNWITFIDQTTPVYSLHPNAPGQNAIRRALEHTIEHHPYAITQ